MSSRSREKRNHAHRHRQNNKNDGKQNKSRPPVHAHSTVGARANPAYSARLAYWVCTWNDTIPTKWTSECPNIEMPTGKVGGPKKGSKRSVPKKKPAAASVETPAKKPRKETDTPPKDAKLLKSTARELEYSSVYHKVRRLYESKGWDRKRALKKAREAANKHCQEKFGK